ncbi:MAG TPA: hypothetical protein VG147_15315 [Solirubrobacteraceae bacterium]|jgi:hypothetical protein|nr:hypothetical protein [Solirubrobacteraceae bacterium]
MFKVRMILFVLLSAIGLLATSAVASARTGPVWHVNGVKLAAGETRLIRGENFAGSLVKLKSTVLGTAVTIYCSAAKIEGKLIGGNPGKDEETIEYSSCSVEGAAGCEVTLGRTKASTELGYESSTSSQIVEVYNAAGAFTTVTIKKRSGETCLLTLNTTEVRLLKEDKYDVACVDTHQEVEEYSGLYMCVEPALSLVELGGQSVAVGMEIGGQPATLTADLLFKMLTEELKFGAYKE